MASRFRRGPGSTPGATPELGTPGKRTLIEAIQHAPGGSDAAVPRHGDGDASSGQIHAAAARGVSAPATAMPHGATIQRLFGRHDISGVQAHVGGTAADACRDMNASAFATGNHVAFANSPDLHTAAHEAAHVVQQVHGVQLYGGVGEAGNRYEHHADRVADAVVRGESAAGIVDEVTGGGSAAPVVQRMQMSAADQAVSARFVALVQNRIPLRANDARLVGALNTAGTNTGATKRDIKADLAWGAGPTVKIAPLAGAVGEFTPGTGSSEIRVRKLRVDEFQSEADASRLPGHELYLEDAIIHEYTHYLDDQDGTDRPGEEGEEFENATYGKVITGVSDALDNVLKGEFWAGDWTAKVEGKEAGFKQRFVVSGAKSGDGTYDGVVGTSAAVKADAGTKWQIKVQHDDGTGWKDSTIHKVKEGTDNFLMRSEDWTDRDMNDLEIRVKK
jgi:hypothetical protein